MSQFAGAAARQHGDNRKPRIQSVTRGESLACNRRMHGIHERMPDPVCLHACLAVESFLEWKNAQTADKPSLHQPYTPGPPGPELRANKINVAHMLAAKHAREAQMKRGEIGQNCERRPAPLDFGNEPPPSTA